MRLITAPDGLIAPAIRFPLNPTFDPSREGGCHGTSKPRYCGCDVTGVGDGGRVWRCDGTLEFGVLVVRALATPVRHP